MPSVRVQSEDFDIGAEIDALCKGRVDAGAVVSFTGLVRDMGGDPEQDSLSLEHYPGMTETSLLTILDDAQSRWSLLDVLVIHRIGILRPSDRIVLVLVLSNHRGDAFHACEFIMDYLKTRAPFWKKETVNGQSAWVESRSSDESAARRWEK